MDLHKRTIVKTITWRAIATLTTVIAIYYWTKSWVIALSSGIIANVLKTFFYYIHERLWNLTDYGRLHVSVKKNKRRKKN